MTSSYGRAQARRATLRRRLDAKHPLFADQFFARDVARHRGYYAGQLVPAPAKPRRRRPAHRSVNRATQQAFKARQLDLLEWRPRRRDFIQALLRKVQEVLRRGMQGIALKLFPSRSTRRGR